MKNNSRDDNIWVFNAGNSFSGNPKWLFLYIKKYRKDIQPYWLCYEKELLTFMRASGHDAYLFDSKNGREIARKAGVYVVNQVKEIIQDELKDVKILNLWHGVGCKTIERKVDFGFLHERIAKKYIRNNSIYKNNQLFLVTSPLMESHFITQCGIDDDKIIRAGYPCCKTDDLPHGFDHEILAEKFADKKKIAIYAPTYRDKSKDGFFMKAIPDMKRLLNVLAHNDILMIFKMHPLMEKDTYYQEMKCIYENHPNVLFWDNKYDVYEIFSKIDIAIIDYSSIFYDMLASGVKSFIRYMFDIDDSNNIRDFVFDVKEMTCGYDCDNFEELLSSLSQTNKIDSPITETERKRIYDLFWSYADNSTNEDIIEAAMNFEIDNHELPKLFSFDIFDTLIQRNTLLPIGVFYYVQDSILNENFPEIIKKDYVRIRMSAETNVRTWYKKTVELRGDERLEITLDEIYKRIQNVYELTDNQIERLKRLEIEGEYIATMPRYEQIKTLKNLIAHNQKVILISDMYLPKCVIQDMLRKVDPILAEIPLYLSSEIGVQKTTKKLYLTVYNDLDYVYSEWIHFGDNINADKKQPVALGIKTINHELVKFNNYESLITNKIHSYDAYVVSSNMARMRFEATIKESSKEYFAYSYVALCFVPYINWALRHAMKEGYKTLYFISRDGYHLKRIADEIIAIKKYPIKTKYIYGSRKVWRIPSYIDNVDDEFFGEYGNLSKKIKNYNNLLKSMNLDNDEFKELFPEFAHLEKAQADIPKSMQNLRRCAKESNVYRKRLLEKARLEREIVIKYLRQEIDFSEPFAFIEYWGRGYTQDCLTRLLEVAAERKIKNPFYYARSIYETEGSNVRYNFTTNNASLLFVEAIFANMPYRSISQYKRVGDKVAPVIQECDNDTDMHEAMERYLVKFTNDFCTSELIDEECIEKNLFNFAMDYYRDHQKDALLWKNIAHLKDSVEQYGKAQEFAPEITFKSILRRVFKSEYFKTKSKEMSIARSKKVYRKIYVWYKDKFKKTRWYQYSIKLYRKIRRIICIR